MTEPLASVLCSYLLGIPATDGHLLCRYQVSIHDRSQPQLVRRGLALRSLALTKGMLLLFGAAAKKTGGRVSAPPP
jgi:hypothetical protein